MKLGVDRSIPTVRSLSTLIDQYIEKLFSLTRDGDLDFSVMAVLGTPLQDLPTVDPDVDDVSTCIRLTTPESSGPVTGVK